MEILTFTHSHLAAARELVRRELLREKEENPAFPLDREPFPAIPELSSFAENELGVAAVEGDTLLGFLCCVAPFDNAFGTTGVKGVWSPLHAHGAVEQERERIFERLYQAAAGRWVKAGALSHSVTFLSYDVLGKFSLFQSGFGLRCVDAAARLTAGGAVPGEGEDADGFFFHELATGEVGELTELNNLLIRHLSSSPVFMSFPPVEEEELRKMAEDGVRFFGAKRKGEKYAAYLKLAPWGENFLCSQPEMVNICGAYCLPQHRGTGLMTALLKYVMETAGREGYRYLGVDYEGFNLSGRHFWQKHFTEYTHSLVRRIDENPRR